MRVVMTSLKDLLSWHHIATIFVLSLCISTYDYLWTLETACV